MEMDNIKYPNVTVKLMGEDGNAFMLIGIVLRGLKKANVPQEEIEAFTAECFRQEDYNSLLIFLVQTVNVE